jgi:hypothetical protein
MSSPPDGAHARRKTLVRKVTVSAFICKEPCRGRRGRATVGARHRDPVPGQPALRRIEGALMLIDPARVIPPASGPVASLQGSRAAADPRDYRAASR